MNVLRLFFFAACLVVCGAALLSARLSRGGAAANLARRSTTSQLNSITVRDGDRSSQQDRSELQSTAALPLPHSFRPGTMSPTLLQTLNLRTFVSNSWLLTNSPPTAVADTFTGLAARHQDAPGVLANDYDPDGDNERTTMVRSRIIIMTI
jgi:hypothetical protein